VALAPVKYGLEDKSGKPSTWRVTAVSLREKLAGLYVCSLELRHDGDQAHPDDLLGRSSCLVMTRGAQARRLCGIIRAVYDMGVLGEDTVVSAELVPALWALTQTQQARIFQQQTVPDIVERVLTAGLKPYQRTMRKKLQRTTYPLRDYCVQYRESDYDFATRLMREEGLVFIFDHSAGTEEVVLVDANASYTHLGDLQVGGQDAAVLEEETVRKLHLETTLRSTKVTLRDYDWHQPPVPVLWEAPPSDSEIERELYDPAAALTLGAEGDDGEAQAQLRLEASRMEERVGLGMSNVVELMPGTTFELKGSGDSDGRYLITEMIHRGTPPDRPSSADAPVARPYENEFTCIPADVPFRPARDSERMTMPGPQTAIVVGPSQEEVYTDDGAPGQGLVKVQFHWDRDGRKNEKSSCWLRVAQMWAGPGYGTFFLPRVGMEVVVDFLDGDPDRPLVVGCVYNGQNAPPVQLPNDKTLSGIVTSTSPGGGGANALTFEDAAGQELVQLTAEKDFSVLVKHNQDDVVRNDATRTVLHNQHLTVALMRGEGIELTDDLIVGISHTLVCGLSYAVAVGGIAHTVVGGELGQEVVSGRRETVGGDKTETIGGPSALSVDSGEARNIIGGLKEKITGDVKREVHHGSVGVTCLGDEKEEVDGNATFTLDKTRDTHVVGKDSLSADKGLTIDSANGDITVTSATGKLKIKASKGLRIKVGGTCLELTPSGVHVVGGGS